MIINRNTHTLSSEAEQVPELSWEDGWTYIKTVTDTRKEPILILNERQEVQAANESYCQHFRVLLGETIGKTVYELGGGQWDSPALRKLFNVVLPDETFFRGHEVTRMFPSIGKKVMLLNARHIHTTNQPDRKLARPLTMLTIEDISDMMLTAHEVAKKILGNK